MFKFKITLGEIAFINQAFKVKRIKKVDEASTLHLRMLYRSRNTLNITDGNFPLPSTMNDSDT